MLNQKIAIIGLFSAGLVIGTGLRVEAASYIRTIDNFYDYYGNNFSQEQQSIINGAFNAVQPFMGLDGKQKVIEAGFRPFSIPLKGHGEHWFLPTALLNPANPFTPTGINFDENGQLVAAFWTQSKYSVPKLFELASVNPATVDPHTFLSAYKDYKQNDKVNPPNIFDVFGEEVMWHSHENVTFRNLGTLNPEDVKFTQSLSDENFVNSLLMALSDDTIVAAPFEQDPSLGYPPFNSLNVPGFYMIHMWLGLGNPTGLLANTHPDVAPNAIDEHLTFEDGHSHHPGHDHTSVPEPSSIISFLMLAFLGAGSALKRKFL